MHTVGTVQDRRRCPSPDCCTSLLYRGDAHEPSPPPISGLSYRHGKMRTMRDPRAEGEHKINTMSAKIEHLSDPADFELHLRRLTGIEGELARDVTRALINLTDSIGPALRSTEQDIAKQFYGRLNQKLTANRDVIAKLYAKCASEGIMFNYPTKRRIEWAINTNDLTELGRQLVERAVPQDFLNHLMAELTPVTQDGTRGSLFSETRSPTKLRKAKERQVANDVFNAAAGPLVWSLWPADRLTSAFSRLSVPYSGDYMKDLRTFQPDLFVRNRSLIVRQVMPEPESGITKQCQELTRWLAAEYDAVDNYGFVALLINIDNEASAEGWRLASDLVLFAERFFESEIKQLFFRPSYVQAQTLAHVRDIDVSMARFELANEGFTYHDTFVLHDEDDKVRRLLILLQKNRRDETLVPCPGCRSDNVRGNSYPNFGVKSWECQNPLCPDRSIYNRGKRYDFRSLLKQEAIETDGNLIPIESVREWQRDVLIFRSDDQILDMVLRHYSMRGDVVALLDTKGVLPDFANRNVELGTEPANTSQHDDFWSSSFFHRYIPESATVREKANSDLCKTNTSWQVIHGDAFEVLQGFPAGTFDRAVTSPPYFNAREYAQWPNIYCYLHDIYRIAEEVFRTLKPGSLFIYNIFDYFDNEQIITFSAMGRKRIPLSAMMVDVFHRIGFVYRGSVAWDKGEIHGKRGFNAGNFSPFYQSPFNCWEHVLVVQKPSQDSLDNDRAQLPCLNKALRIHPVVKMVRGENRHGHTAPYPLDLVAALLAGLPSKAHVLDPFGGSGTTARAALNADLSSTIVERDASYCDLSKRLTTEHEQRLLRQSMHTTLF